MPVPCPASYLVPRYPLQTSKQNHQSVPKGPGSGLLGTPAVKSVERYEYLQDVDGNFVPNRLDFTGFRYSRKPICRGIARCLQRVDGDFVPNRLDFTGFRYSRKLICKGATRSLAGHLNFFYNNSNYALPPEKENKRWIKQKKKPISKI